METAEQKDRVAMFLFGTFPDAECVKISDRITLEFGKDPEIGFTQLLEVTERLCTNDVRLNSMDNFHRCGGEVCGTVVVTVSIENWTFMEETDE